MKESERKKLQGARLAAARMSAGFKSAREAAIAHGWTESSYRSHENGTRTIGPDDAEKYARAYRARGAEVDAAKMLFGSGREIVDEADEPQELREVAPPADGRDGFVLATYGGLVEAGTFREVGEFQDPDREPDFVPRDERFPRAAYFIFEVAGDSMNAADPPMKPGTRVVAVRVDNFRNGLVLQTGDIVVVERTRDDGALRERSVKEIELDDHETRFCPRSTNARHQPIVVPKDYEPDEMTKVEVIALVIDVMIRVRRR